MSHTRKECEHGMVISQCRCIQSHGNVEVIRPCPFGDAHLGYAVVHPEPRPILSRSSYCVAELHDQCPQRPGAPAPRCACPCHATGGAGEPVQLPADGPGGAGAVSLDGQNGPGAAEGVARPLCNYGHTKADHERVGACERPGLNLSRAVKLCVFRTCDWTIAEPDSLLAVAAMDAEIRVHLRTHRVEIETLARCLQ